MFRVKLYFFGKEFRIVPFYTLKVLKIRNIYFSKLTGFWADRVPGFYYQRSFLGWYDRHGIFISIEVVVEGSVQICCFKDPLFFFLSLICLKSSLTEHPPRICWTGLSTEHCSALVTDVILLSSLGLWTNSEAFQYWKNTETLFPWLGLQWGFWR